MGLSNVFGRLSFVAFPVILFSPDSTIRKNVNLLLKVFAISTLAYVFSCFAYAFSRSLSFVNGNIMFNPYLAEYEWQNYFFGSDFTYSIHPSYLAMFVLLAAFISFESGKIASIKIFKRILWFFAGGSLLVSLYFISSRAAILAGIIMCLFYAVVKLINNRSKRIYWAGAIVLIFALLPPISRNDRVKYFLDDLVHFSINPKEGLNDDRIITWKTALKIIRENFILGVGIGDVRAELVKEYSVIKAENHVNQRLNAHNQFIEIFLENGIIGFALFTGIFSWMIYLAVCGRNLLYGLFIIMMFVFFMFETVLYRLAGVAFFSIFAFLLIHVNPNEINQCS
jgi:O-antigen ligase